MYQALYRKYRPKNFNEVVGQDVIIKTLKNAIENNRISHAYIFTGPRGTGKTSTAKIFAKMVNCKQLVNGIPCDSCECCVQFNNNQNVDIIEIDAASNNGVDEIRELKNKVSLVPSISKYKVYIIDEVHMLSTSAFNALLKTLEEPPSHVIFILATTDPHKVLPTILSRCQRFDFKKVSDLSIKDRLKNISKMENIDIEEDALIEISRLANGGMRDALSIYDQVIAFSDGKITSNDVHEVNGTITQESLKMFIDKVKDNNLKDIFSFIDDYEIKGKNFLKLVEEMILFFKNILILKKIPDFLSDDKVSIYSNFIDYYSDERLLDIIDILNKSISNMKSFNNSRLVFELSLIKIINLFDDSSKMIKKNNDADKELSSSNVSIQTINEEKLSEKELELKIDSMKKVRINNTLARFDKRILLKIKEKISNLNSYMTDSENSEYILMIIDCEIKAASDEYIIFVAKTENMSKVFNKNIYFIENIISSKLNKSYKVIAVSSMEWEIIKREFNNKEKKFEYSLENTNYSDLFGDLIKKNNDSSIDSIFKNIVEYK